MSANKGFGVFVFASELFNNLKSKGDLCGGGCICKLISSFKIVKSAVNIIAEMISALNIFEQIQELCSSGEPNRMVYEVQEEIMSHSMQESNPDNLGYSRNKVLKAIADRQGQAKFWFNLI